MPPRCVRLRAAAAAKPAAAPWWPVEQPGHPRTSHHSRAVAVWTPGNGLLQRPSTHPAPPFPPTHQVGSWDDISGETFLRQLLSMPIEEATFKTGRESLFNNASSMGVDPRK